MTPVAQTEPEFSLSSVELDEAAVLHSVLEDVVGEIRSLNSGSEALSSFWIVPSVTIHRLEKLLEVYYDSAYFELDMPAKDFELSGLAVPERPKRTFKLGDLYVPHAAYPNTAYEIVGINHREGTGMPGICLRLIPTPEDESPFIDSRPTRFWVSAAKLLWQYDRVTADGEIMGEDL